MALTKFTQDIEVISKLDDEPNDVGGLSPAELKSKYDEAGKAIQQYINETLTPEIDTNKADKSELQDIVLGQIPDGTITKPKLSSYVQALIEKADGSVQQSDKATEEEAIAGTDDTKYMTPVKVKQAVDSWDTPLLTRKKMNTDWELLQQYIAAGSYSWVAPDLFDGAPYDIGVVMIGGGASGMALACPTPTSSRTVAANGGSSGVCKAFEITVTPGTSYPLVIGAGGLAASVTQSGSGDRTLGNNGNTTSGFGKTVSGGVSSFPNFTADFIRFLNYQPPEIPGSNGFTTTAGVTNSLEGGIPTVFLYSSVVSYYLTLPCGLCFDPFKNTPICSAGEGMSIYLSSSGTINSSYKTSKGPDGGSTPTAIVNYNTTGTAGSLGSGGGAAIAVGTSKVATSGAGGPGYIKIYVKGMAS